MEISIKIRASRRRRRISGFRFSDTFSESILVTNLKITPFVMLSQGLINEYIKPCLPIGSVAHRRAIRNPIFGVWLKP